MQEAQALFKKLSPAQKAHIDGWVRKQTGQTLIHFMMKGKPEALSSMVKEADKALESGDWSFFTNEAEPAAAQAKPEEKPEPKQEVSKPEPAPEPKAPTPPPPEAKPVVGGGGGGGTGTAVPVVVGGNAASPIEAFMQAQIAAAVQAMLPGLIAGATTAPIDEDAIRKIIRDEIKKAKVSITLG